MLGRCLLSDHTTTLNLGDVGETHYFISFSRSDKSRVKMAQIIFIWNDLIGYAIFYIPPKIICMNKHHLIWQFTFISLLLPPLCQFISYAKYSFCVILLDSIILILSYLTYFISYYLSRPSSSNIVLLISIFFCLVSLNYFLLIFYSSTWFLSSFISWISLSHLLLSWSYCHNIIGKMLSKQFKDSNDIKLLGRKDNALT